MDWRTSTPGLPVGRMPISQLTQHIIEFQSDKRKKDRWLVGKLSQTTWIPRLTENFSQREFSSWWVTGWWSQLDLEAGGVLRCLVHSSNIDTNSGQKHIKSIALKVSQALTSLMTKTLGSWNVGCWSLCQKMPSIQRLGEVEKKVYPRAIEASAWYL
jgi:hypothetical protein